ATAVGSIARRAGFITKGHLPGAQVATIAPHGASRASNSQQVAGGKAMRKILIPVGGTRNDRFAVQHVIKRFMNDTAIEVHLVNVQVPFSAYVATFSSRESR